MPDSVWLTVGTSRPDRKSRDGGPGGAGRVQSSGRWACSRKRKGHNLIQGSRGRAGFSLGDGGHIAARLEGKLKRTAGAGRVQSSGRWACSREASESRSKSGAAGTCRIQSGRRWAHRGSTRSSSERQGQAGGRWACSREASESRSKSGAAGTCRTQSGRRWAHSGSTRRQAQANGRGRPGSV